MKYEKFEINGVKVLANYSDDGNIQSILTRGDAKSIIKSDLYNQIQVKINKMVLDKSE